MYKERDRFDLHVDPEALFKLLALGVVHKVESLKRSNIEIDGRFHAAQGYAPHAVQSGGRSTT